MLHFITTKRTDPRLLELMKRHYSKPKGFVGRNICYAIMWNNEYYGHIIGGSCCFNLPGRDKYFGINRQQLINIVNNIFFRVERINDKYPCRNFTNKILKLWRSTIINDWKNKYNDNVIGFETLVEPPRSGECYLRDKWEHLGKTKGFTCKRVAGKSNEKWSGKRVWDKTNLRPKLIFVKRNIK